MLQWISTHVAELCLLLIMLIPVYAMRLSSKKLVQKERPLTLPQDLKHL
jgi:hypothetical protein